MRLYTPVSAEDADRLAHGDPLADALVWVDRPVPEESAAGAVWMVIELAEADLRQFEQAVAPELGYREFLLPASVLTGRHATSPSL